MTNITTIKIIKMAVVSPKNIQLRPRVVLDGKTTNLTEDNQKSSLRDYGIIDDGLRVIEMEPMTNCQMLLWLVLVLPRMTTRRILHRSISVK